MKNVLKRNQIIILVIALMLVSAGYLSYSGNINLNEEQNTKETATIDVEDSKEYAGIGDAKLVNSNDVVESTKEVAIVPNEETSNTEEEAVKDKQEIEETSSNANDGYFSESRLNRETMYSQMLDSYQKILESDSISETQKSIAQTEVKNINDIKNKIMICENLIKTKGIEDLVIFVNDKSINVIVKEKELSQEKIAQIQNIIGREMNAEVDNIHISNK